MNRSLSSALSRPLSSIRSFSSFSPSSSSSSPSSSFIHSYSSSIRSTSLSSSPLSSSGSLLTGSSSLSSLFPSSLSSSLSSAFSFAALSLYQISIRPASKIESGHAGQIKYDSAGKRLGIKIFGGARAKPGSIIARQRGTKYHPGWNVGLGRDHTIYSLVEGRVHFTRLRRWFRKQRRVWTFINVLPHNGSIDELERDFNARQEKLDLLYNWKKQNIKPLTDVKQKQLQKRKIQVEKWRESQDSTLQKMLQEIDAASSSPSSSSEQQTAAATTN